MKSEGVPLTLKQLAVKGNDLIECGISAGQVGKTLNFLLEQAAMGCVPNQNEKLLIFALRNL